MLIIITESKLLYDNAVETYHGGLIVLVSEKEKEVIEFHFKGDVFTDTSRLPVYYRNLASIVGCI